MTAVAEIYRTTIKKPDFLWNTYVCRPVAAVVVRMLEGTRVTPNQVTLFAFVVALVAVAVIALAPGYWGLVAGVVVFELSYVLDCADGMLARLRNTQSTSGHLLDFLMDEIKAFAILGAVAVRLYLTGNDVRHLLVGIAGLVFLASGIALTTFMRRPEIAPESSGAESVATAKPSVLGRIVALAEGGARFLIHYPSYILVVALAGHIEWYFFPYVAVNALYTARALAQVAWRFGR